MHTLHLFQKYTCTLSVFDTQSRAQVFQKRNATRKHTHTPCVTTQAVLPRSPSRLLSLSRSLCTSLSRARARARSLSLARAFPLLSRLRSSRRREQAQRSLQTRALSLSPYRHRHSSTFRGPRMELRFHYTSVQAASFPHLLPSPYLGRLAGLTRALPSSF